MAPRSITCDAQRAAPRATAWASRSRTCDAQQAAPRKTAWAPRSAPARRRGQLLEPVPWITMRPFTSSAPHSVFFLRTSFANKQNSNAEVLGVGAQCLCGPRACSLCSPLNSPGIASNISAVCGLRVALHQREEKQGQTTTTACYIVIISRLLGGGSRGKVSRLQVNGGCFRGCNTPIKKI